MIIKNNPREYSKLAVVFFLTAGVIVTAGLMLLYNYLNFLAIGHYTLDGFVGWCGIFLLFPAILYICGIIALIKRHQLIKKSFSKKNLTSIDFLPDRIKFNFVDSKYNFVAAYKDLELLLKIETKFVSSPSYRELKSYIISAVNLTFNIRNQALARIIGESISLRNSSTFRKMKLIYQIIDYEKKFEKFNYYISDPGPRASITEQIETYRKTKHKQIFTRADRRILKYLSISIFVLLMVGNFLMKKDLNLETDFAFFTVFISAPILTFILDTFMLLDRSNENDKFFIRNIIIFKITLLIIYAIY